MKRSVVIKQLGYEASAGWTTYGTSLADFHCFRAAQRDMKGPQKSRGLKIEDRGSKIRAPRVRRFSILDPRSSILDPRSSILDPLRLFNDPGRAGHRATRIAPRQTGPSRRSARTR